MSQSRPGIWEIVKSKGIWPSQASQLVFFYIHGHLDWLYQSQGSSSHFCSYRSSLLFSGMNRILSWYISSYEFKLGIMSFSPNWGGESLGDNSSVSHKFFSLINHILGMTSHIIELLLILLHIHLSLIHI